MNPRIQKSISLFTTVFILSFLLNACTPPTPTISPAELTRMAKPSLTVTPVVKVVDMSPTSTPTPPSPLVGIVSKMSPLCEASFLLNEKDLPRNLYGVNVESHELMAVVKDVVFPENGWQELIIIPDLMAVTPKEVKYLACVETSPVLAGRIITTINDETNTQELFALNWRVHLVDATDGTVLLTDLIYSDAPTPKFAHEIAYSRDNRSYGAPPSVKVLNEWLTEISQSAYLIRLEDDSGQFGIQMPYSSIWPDNQTFAQRRDIQDKQDFSKYDDVIVEWDMYTGKVVNQREIGFIDDGSSEYQFIPNRDWLVTYRFDSYTPKVLNIWDIGKGERIYSLMEDTEEIRTIAVSPDGNMLATGDQEGNLRLWSLEDGTLMEKWTMDVINSMAFSPDEKILAISFEDAVKLLDINTGNTRSLGVIFNNTGYGGFRFAFSANGNKLAVWDMDQVSLWDLATGQKDTDIDFPENGYETIILVALSPDGAIVATALAKEERLLTLWNGHNGSVVRTLLKHPIYDFDGEFPNFLSFSQDGSSLILGTEAEGIGYHLRTWKMQ